MKGSMVFFKLWGAFHLLHFIQSYENIALNKKAWQEHTQSDFGADRAVDGLKLNLSSNGGQCASFGYDHKSAEWRVDLGDILSIHHILIQYATDNRKWDESNHFTQHFLGFSVYISNTTNKEDGILCFRDTNYTRATIHNPVTINCPYHGRYVTYYNNRTHPPFPTGYISNVYGDLCEVEVYGCPAAHGYGKGCSKPCPQNCHRGSCNAVNGMCPDCVDGYTGPMCNIKCKAGTYGHNCTEPCGMCLSKDQCHHVYGTCLNGCRRGYQGFTCKEVCAHGYYGYNCNNTCELNCSTRNATCDIFTGFCSQVPTDRNYDIAAISGALMIIGVFIIVITVILAIKRKRSIIQKFYYVQRNKHYRKTGSDTRGCDGLPNLPFPNTSAGNVENDIELVHLSEGINFPQRPQQNRDESENPDPQYLISTPGEDEPRTNDKIPNCVKRNASEIVDVHDKNISDIPIHELQKSIAIKKKQDNEEFRIEYSILPCGEQHVCEIGKRQENIPKNRYKNAFPYDDTRVILRGIDIASDYINASYIKDTDGRNAYIATQGPKRKTMDDFWTMVWQENISKIVMLNNLKEEGKVKCTQYWPELMEVIHYGSIEVYHIEEKKCAFYVIRNFTVTHKELHTSRDIQQYQYITWPDHGAPDPLCLTVFHCLVLKANQGENDAPLLVHCSAGVGRTGTYIAIDALYKEGKMTGRINVVEYVKDMRSCRMNMVQTYEQYMTIFLALNEEFKASVEIQSLTDFMTYTQSLKGDDPASDQAFRQEFTTLLQIRPEYTRDHYKFAVQEGVNEMETAVLPLDKYVLYLNSPVAGRGSYINAIQLSSYLQNRALIVTSYPTLEDAVDFLRLLIDHELGTVVCMDPLSEVESSKTWFPEPLSFKTVTPFRVLYVNNDETDVTVTNIQVKKEEGMTHPVVVVEPRRPLISTELFQDTSCLRSLVSYAMKITSTGPITIISRDGASMCGVFCAVFNSVQQIRMDDSVDVFTTVRQLQARRREFCSTLDEYLLVYKTLRDHIMATSENLYYNL